MKERLRKNKRLLHSLQYAKLQQELQSYEQSLAQYKAELEKHDAEGEVADYEAQLEIEHAKLHGYFQSQLEQLEKTLEQLEIERRPMKETIEKLTEQAAKQQTEHEEAKRDFHLIEGQITTKNDQLAKLKQQILANPAQEDVATELNKWSERHQWLDEELIRLQQFKKTTEQKITIRDEEKNEQ